MKNATKRQVVYRVCADKQQNLRSINRNLVIFRQSVRYLYLRIIN